MDSKPMHNAEVKIISDLNEFPKVTSISTNGTYIFNEVPINNQYLLTASNTMPHADGVTTLDLVMTQRHILGTQKFNSAPKAIAADVNNDGKVTSGDLVDMRKLILGVNAKFPKSNSWKFIDSKQNFANINSPFPHKEVITVDLEETAKTDIDFLAIKMGDVNNSITLLYEGEVEPRSNVLINVGSKSIDNIEEYTFSLDQTQDILGMQFELNFDPKKMEFIGVEAGKINMSENDIGVSEVQEGRIKISWLNERNDVVLGDLFKLKFRKKYNEISELSILKQSIRPEIYINDYGQVETRRLTLNHLLHGDSRFELYQNTPNPFSDATIIGFNLGENSRAKLKVFDPQGKLILEKNGEFKRGYNQFELTAKEVGLNGLMYYQVEAGDNISQRIMIVIN
jgi:hypothetical protein